MLASQKYQAKKDAKSEAINAERGKDEGTDSTP